MRRWWLELELVTELLELVAELLELVAELFEIILAGGVVYYILGFVCCTVPTLGFLEPLVEARCSTTRPKVSSARQGSLPEARQWPSLHPASDFGRAD